MALSEFEKERIKKIFSSYCHKRMPLHHRDHFKVEYEIIGNEVKLHELRPSWQDKGKWISHTIARFKKDIVSESWVLYCADRNRNWRIFEPYPSHKDISKLLEVVDNDKTGIFWG